MIAFLSPAKLEDLKQILAEHNYKKEKLVGFFENKLVQEKELVKTLLNRLWNEMDVKTKEMADVFEEIDNHINSK